MNGSATCHWSASGSHVVASASAAGSKARTRRPSASCSRKTVRSSTRYRSPSDRAQANAAGSRRWSSTATSSPSAVVAEYRHAQENRT
ncbi:MAG: hypothetical protein AVDCRST_MAG54-1218 [uncultured Actinomycetospora sp.]|uniref:Uncharacterized protein n=1 Tax=uncultured Actinomycetospora sp. TaxID=1135996 RepID=A0A6J4HWS6_9PSEU|nr:MAG: hypothetical protein AVDCRST_MAG54-1218 [uncultured Actinomycetospora sp.]